MFPKITSNVKTTMLNWKVITLVWEGVLQVLIVGTFHDKVPDLNSCLAQLPTA